MHAETSIASLTPTTVGVDDATDIFAAARSSFRDLARTGVRDIDPSAQKRQTVKRELGNPVDLVLGVCAKNGSNAKDGRAARMDEHIPGFPAQKASGRRQGQG